MLVEVLGQVLRHALGQRRHQHAFLALHAQTDLRQQVVHLRPDRADVHFRVHQSSRPDHLLDDLAGLLQFESRRRRRDVDGLRLQVLEFVEPQRPVVEGRRQAESILDQGLLARTVATVHAHDLRNGHVTLVDDQHRVARQVIEQAGRRLARCPPRQVARVVLDARAVTHLGHHLDIEQGALFQALRLYKLVPGAELDEPLPQLFLDLVENGQQSFPGRDVVRRREDGQARHPAKDLAGQRVEERQRLDLLVEELHPHGLAIGLRRKDVDHVAPHAERALAQVHLVARVLHVGQPPEQLALVEPVASHQVQHHLEVGLRVPQPVDRGDRGHDERIRSLQQRLGGRESHLLDLLVDRGVLLDVGVRRGDVGLRLVVVVIGNEVLDRVVREILLELAVQLRGQGLVVRKHERRPLQALDHVGNREGLAGARDAQQRLVRKAGLEAVDQAGDRLGLVAGRTVARLQVEFRSRRHAYILIVCTRKSDSAPVSTVVDALRRAPARWGFTSP